MDERQQLAQEICDLKSQLTSVVSDIGDWKICKCYEYVLLGKEPPYDVEELHAARQAVRDKINECQARLDELELVDE